MNPASSSSQTPIAPIIPKITGAAFLYIQIAFVIAILGIGITVSGLLKERNPRPIFLAIMFLGGFMGYTFQLISLQWMAAIALIIVFLLVMILARFAKES
jgi:hypothetical protein